MSEETPVTRREVKALLAMLPSLEEFRKSQTTHIAVKANGEMPSFGWSMTIERDGLGLVSNIICRPFEL